VKFGVVVFPGSNCDQDTLWVAGSVCGQGAEFLWHKDHDLKGCDCIILPGGFAYGDYLRSGAIARFSPIMQEVADFAQRGGLVLGICNGFQVLQEMRLLPGAMLRNQHLKFLCRHVDIRIENAGTPFTRAGTEGMVLSIPIAHFDGNFHIDPEGLEELRRNRQIMFRYCEPDGSLSEAANVNGSLEAIAGVSNRAGNVVGLMPHPERASEELLGSADGRVIFDSIIRHFEEVSS